MRRDAIREARAQKMERRAKKKKRIVFFLVELLILVGLLGTTVVLSKYDKLQKVSIDDQDIIFNEGINDLQTGYSTIALFGGDSREGVLGEGTNTDSIIIVSIDNETKEIRLCSVYRDTVVEIEEGNYRKANSAYFLGGPKGAINMLNRNLDLSITDYVTVDFVALVDVIDLLGGLELEIQEEEVEEVNKFLGETARVANREEIPLTKAGMQVLDGAQAVTYARIRSTAGGDFKRTERQRYVLEQLFGKVKGADLSQLNELLNQVFPKVSTNFTLTELFELAGSAAKYTFGETAAYPKDVDDVEPEAVEKVGDALAPIGLTENVEMLHAFLFPKENYSPSETILFLNDEIAWITGIYREDYNLNSDTEETKEASSEEALDDSENYEEESGEEYSQEWYVEDEYTEEEE